MNLRNKWVMGILGVGAAAMIGVSASAVYAQSSTTDDASAVGQLRPGRGGENEEALADALGITVEELDAAKAEVRANLIAEAVAAGEITQDEADLMLAREALREFMSERMQSAYDEALADAVTEGIITQEQADQIASEGGAGFFGPGMDGGGRGGPNDGHGGGHGRGHGGPGGDWRGPQQAPPPAEDAPEDSSSSWFPSFSLDNL